MDTHNRQAIAVSSVSLESVERRLTEWRRTHKAPCPIPADVWAEAVEAASQHGAYRVARTLRLDYAALKRRMAGRPDARRKSGTPGSVATFVELLPPVGSGTIGECALEVESTRGARLRVVMKNMAPSGLASIIREFAG